MWKTNVGTVETALACKWHTETHWKNVICIVSHAFKDAGAILVRKTDQETTRQLPSNMYGVTYDHVPRVQDLNLMVNILYAIASILS